MTEEITVPIKKKKKNPQTLNDRLGSIFKKNNIELPLTVDQKLELGKICATRFYEFTSEWDNHKPYLMTKKIEENGNEIVVRLYPSFFVPTLDAMIFDYLKQNNIYVKKEI